MLPHLVLTAVLLFSTLGSTAESNGTIITDEFSAYVEQVLTGQNVPGLSLGVVKPDGDIEFGAWGNSTEDGRLVDADTIFAIGSCTKAFLTASLGILMDDFDNGRNVTALPYPLSTFGWDTKVKDLLPGEWVIDDEWVQEKVALRDILSHVSGRVAHDFSYKPNDSLQDVVHRFRYHNSPFELRQTFAYNNEMYVAGTYILTKYAGKSFASFADDRIFKPLGMNSTTLSPAAATTTGNFSQAWQAGGRRIPFWFTEESNQIVGGAGAVLSSARDMTKWIQMLLNDGTHLTSNETIIPPSALGSVTTASVVVLGTGQRDILSIVGYGMGWERFSYRGQDAVAHDGGLPGFASWVELLPSTGLGVVSLANTEIASVANSVIAARVVDDVIGLDHLNSSSSVTGTEDVEGLNSSSPLSLHLEDYTGTYYRPDYGNITFCTYTGNQSAAHGNQTSGDYCSSLRSQFAIVDAAEGKQRPEEQLIAAYDCMWSKQIRLVHIQEDTFAFVATTLFTDGFGADNSPFESASGESGATTARFIIEDGGPSEHRVKGFFACGIMRGTDAIQGNCTTGEGAQPNSLAWFDKVG